MRKFLLTSAALIGTTSVEAANPIRRVVTLLQDMSKEISAEMEQEKVMFKKYECYCKKNTESLTTKIDEGQAVIKKKKAEAEAMAGEKKRLEEELVQHKSDRKKNQDDLAATHAKRTTEKTSFTDSDAEQAKYVSDLGRAVAALEKARGSSFLQTEGKVVKKYLKHISQSSAIQSLDLQDQQTLASFLQGDFSSSSGEIVGILKQMQEQMAKDLAEMRETEASTAAATKELVASLEEMIDAAGSAIESKTETKGEVAVKLVEATNVVSTTETQVATDSETLSELKTSCVERSKDFEVRQKDGAAELNAIGEAVKILNNDDSLETFNKAVKKPAFTQLSLLQLSKRNPVNIAIRSLDRLSSASPSIALLAFSAKQALKSGKKVDFSKVLAMIGDMVKLLKQEQKDDRIQLDDCNKKITEYTAAKKDAENVVTKHERDIADNDATIAEQTATIAKETHEIETAKTSIQESGVQRKKENAEFISAVKLNREAIELLLKAKDKLNEYYNPGQVRKTHSIAVTEKEAGEAFVALPEGAPEMWKAGKRESKGQASGGVLGLLDKIAAELQTDVQAAEHEEKTAQRDYLGLVKSMNEQIAESGKRIIQAQETKAAAESAKNESETALSSKKEELDSFSKLLSEKTAACEFIMNSFDDRKTARSAEIDGLVKATSVLKGANFDE